MPVSRPVQWEFGQLRLEQQGIFPGAAHLLFVKVKAPVARRSPDDALAIRGPQAQQVAPGIEGESNRVVAKRIRQPQIVVVGGQIFARHHDARFIWGQDRSTDVVELRQHVQRLAITIDPQQLTPLPVGMWVINQQSVVRRRKVAAAITDIGALHRAQPGSDALRFAAGAQRFGVEGLRHQPTVATKQQVAALAFVRIASDKYGIGIVLENTLPKFAIQGAHINATLILLAAADGQVEKTASIGQEEWLVQIGLSGIRRAAPLQAGRPRPRPARSGELPAR